jgi:hypothetical protein
MLLLKEPVNVVTSYCKPPTVTTKARAEADGRQGRSGAEGQLGGKRRKTNHLKFFK